MNVSSEAAQEGALEGGLAVWRRAAASPSSKAGEPKRPGARANRTTSERAFAGVSRAAAAPPLL